jgi:hypothetical protein
MDRQRGGNLACPKLSHANAACVIVQPFGKRVGYGETAGALSSASI